MQLKTQSYTAPLENTNHTFWIFITIHILLWTLGPLIARESLPHDTLEGIAWGQQMEWGYSKHPFLTAWLIAVAARLSEGGDWAIYLLAQFAVALTFYAVWKLALDILKERQALIATLILEAVLFYNINSFNLTPDTLQSPLWALFTLTLYKALKTQLLRYWLLTGVFAALCIVTKYQAVLLLGSAFFFCIIHQEARVNFQKKEIYAAFFLMLLIILPHFHWLYQHDFISFRYALQTPSEYSPRTNHILYPIVFILEIIARIICVFLILAPSYQKKGRIALTSFQNQFLLCLGLGPLIISLIVSVILGKHLPIRWATPYFFLIGILTVAYFKIDCSLTNFKTIKRALFIFSFLLFTGYIGKACFFQNPSSDAYLPNKQFANHITTLWHERYQTPLPYIAGTGYLVAALVHYSKDQPIPFFNWSEKETTWLHEEEVREQGAVFVWDTGKNYGWDKSSANHSGLAPDIQRKYPTLEFVGEYTVRNKEGKPVTIGIGLLPPGV